MSVTELKVSVSVMPLFRADGSGEGLNVKGGMEVRKSVLAVMRHRYRDDLLSRHFGAHRLNTGDRF